MKIDHIVTQSISIGFAAMTIAPSMAAASVFKDVPQNAWFASYVQQAVDLGIVTGYRDSAGNPTGIFGPADSVSVTQALKMEVESIGVDVDQYRIVPDEYGNDPPASFPWWYTYFQIAHSQGVNLSGCAFLGDGEDYAGHERPMRRWEMARLLADVYKLSSTADEDDPVFGEPSLDLPNPRFFNRHTEPAVIRLPSGDRMQTFNLYNDDEYENPYTDLDVQVVMRGENGWIGRIPPVVDSPIEVSKIEFTDDAKNKSAILQLTEDGVLAGEVSANGSRIFRPMDTVNRAEAVKLFLRAREIYPPSKAARPASFDLENRTPEICR